MTATNAFPDPCMGVDGHGAEAGTPLLFALMSGYGHFTATQVRDGRMRGPGFHLARLDAATRELFGERLDGDLVRERGRHALGRKALRATLPYGCTSIARSRATARSRW
ncbi:hypothetical protein [Streptomyces chrestomyceticus]